eukprot:scaffold22332_cov94-Isochrysis_galbana.AAC.1
MAKRGGGGGEGEERRQRNGVMRLPRGDDGGKTVEEPVDAHRAVGGTAIVESTTITSGPKVGKGEKAAGAAHANRRAEREPRGVRDGRCTVAVGAVGERPWHGERRGARGSGGRHQERSEVRPRTMTYEEHESMQPAVGKTLSRPTRATPEETTGPSRGPNMPLREASHREEACPSARRPIAKRWRGCSERADAGLDAGVGLEPLLPRDRGTRACRLALGTKRLALRGNLKHIRVRLDGDDRRDRRRALHRVGVRDESGGGRTSRRQTSDDAAHHEELEPHAANNPPREAPPPRRRARRGQTRRTRRVVAPTLVRG